VFPFDLPLLHALNGCMHRSPAFDAAVIMLSQNDLLKGGFTMAILFGLWSRTEKNDHARRVSLLATLAGGILAVGLGRALALSMPMRIRPLHDPLVHTVLPFGLKGVELRGWSSFPSDHALVFMAIAFGTFYVSRRAGTLLSVHTALFICMPRIMLGLHYPSDILGGWCIGALTAVVMQRAAVRRIIERVCMPLHEARPGLFHAALFILCFQLAGMFDDLRRLATALVALLKA
jgi:undecaprenyl-diphosphatase